MFLCHEAKVTLFPDIRCAKIFGLGVGASTENFPCADFGSKLTKIISSIPGAGYISAISSGLNLIFGKTTTTTTTSDIKLSTTGNISLTGTGSSQTTADIPPISFNLYDIITSGHFKLNIVL